MMTHKEYMIRQLKSMAENLERDTVSLIYHETDLEVGMGGKHNNEPNGEMKESISITTYDSEKDRTKE